MFELAHRPQASDRDRSLPDGVRAFSIESERLVVVHRRSLLERDGLSSDEHQRLMRLVSDAEAELRRLAV
jgi:hypothetical protein